MSETQDNPAQDTVAYRGPERVFSGIQPSGNLHLGNYLGAIKRFVELKERRECIYCVVDMHAITIWQEPEALTRNIRELTAAYLACGLDPQRSILFNQSQVPEHAELAWVFNCVARMGWMQRMTQFKEKSGKHKERVSLGLFAYPALMAADILAYKATHVPVGEDQKQHVELSRDIALKFNNDYNVPGFFPLPEPVIEGPAMRVMSLRDGTKKMSKSDESDYSRINLTDDADTIALKIRKARTDPEPLPGHAKELEDRPEARNLVNIYAALAGEEVIAVLDRFEGAPFSKFKEDLTELAVTELGPVADGVRRLMADPSEIDRVLGDGAERARAIAAPVMNEVKHIVGFVSPDGVKSAPRPGVRLG
ncbi:MAG: tryptophan--tRNA ligase [Alphaproteobacteria bacterium]